AGGGGRAGGEGGAAPPPRPPRRRRSGRSASIPFYRRSAVGSDRGWPVLDARGSALRTSAGSAPPTSVAARGSAPRTSVAARGSAPRTSVPALSACFLA